MWTGRAGKCACGQSGKVRSERAGKCGFGDMAGKCGRGERESAPVDRAGKCSWGHDRKVRLGAWQESATAKARDTCIAKSKMGYNRLSRHSTETSVSVAGGLLVLHWVTMSLNLVTKVYIVSHW